MFKVPVTVASLRAIKDAGDAQIPGSFLSRLHQDLDDPSGLGAFQIKDEEERERRGRGQGAMNKEQLWQRFRGQVNVFSILEQLLT